jgi:hypothetical protein
MVAKYFNIRQYQRYFDFYDTELEISILDDFRNKNDERVSQSHQGAKRVSHFEQRIDKRSEEKKA